MNKEVLVKRFEDAGENRCRQCLKAVLEAGGCLRCALRFIPISVVGAYEAPEEVLTSAVEAFESSIVVGDTATGRGNPCVCCLGILQDSVMNSVAKECQNRAEEFDFDGVTRLNLSSPPVCSILRQRAMMIHVRNLVKVDASEEAVSLRQGAKYALGNAIETAVSAKYDPKSDFFSNVHFYHDIAATEVDKLLQSKRKKPGSNRHERNYNHKRAKKTEPSDAFPSWNDREVAAIEQASTELSDDAFRGIIAVPPAQVPEFVKFHVLCNVSDILISGRYLKFSREVSQSPWRVEGPDSALSTKVKTSVEELVVPAVKARFKAEQCTFIAGGREDVDVRMLGTGRPFVIRCIGAKMVPARATGEAVRELEETICSSSKGLVRVVALAPATKASMDWLKSVENGKRKTYSCVVWLSRKATQRDVEILNDVRELKVVQKTPLRVFHRRSAGNREKSVHRISARLLEGHYMLVQVEAEAGTYIKELVHGDFGRTMPNFSTILGGGCKTDITQLDVVAIEATP